ncbi:hypothetical protein ACFVGY_17435 [Streptomyces sp. NPDC127106]|uniref:hypothetical protein n=1 Tax=Streptomyces sp. NPDC127106 TaxID=3345360 RepID=UPI00362E4C76
MTDPATYPTGRYTSRPLPCGGCGAEPLPLGGPEGGAVLHEDGCRRAGPRDPVAVRPRQDVP